MKSVCKLAANLFAAIIVLPAVGLCRVGMRLFGTGVFSGWSQGLSLLPGQTGIYLRRAFYAGVLPRCGSDACISFGAVFASAATTVGSKTYIGPFCSLGDVELGDDVLIGSHVSIVNGGRQHGIERLDIPVREQPGDWPRIAIGGDTWIGDRAIVMANVGKHCVVAAGAVVTKPVPDYAIVAGVPARQVGSRCEFENPMEVESKRNGLGSARNTPVSA